MKLRTVMLAGFVSKETAARLANNRRSRLYKRRNKDKVKAYYERTKPERLEQMKAWAARNREHLKAYQHDYYQRRKHGLVKGEFHPEGRGQAG